MSKLGRIAVFGLLFLTGISMVSAQGFNDSQENFQEDMTQFEGDLIYEGMRHSNDMSFDYQGLSLKNTSYDILNKEAYYPAIGFSDRTSNGNFLALNVPTYESNQFAWKFSDDGTILDRKRLTFGGGFNDSLFSGYHGDGYNYLVGGDIRDDEIAVLARQQENGGQSRFLGLMDSNLNYKWNYSFSNKTFERDGGRMVDIDENGDVHIIIESISGTDCCNYNGDPYNVSSNYYMKFDGSNGDVLRDIEINGSGGDLNSSNKSFDFESVSYQEDSKFFEQEMNVHDGTMAVVSDYPVSKVAFVDLTASEPFKNASDDQIYNSTDLGIGENSNLVDIERGTNGWYYTYAGESGLSDTANLTAVKNPFGNSREVKKAKEQFGGSTQSKVFFDRSNNYVYTFVGSRGDEIETKTHADYNFSNDSGFGDGFKDHDFLVLQKYDIAENGLNKVGNLQTFGLNEDAGYGTRPSEAFVTMNDKMYLTGMSYPSSNTPEFGYRYGAFMELDPKTTKMSINTIDLVPEKRSDMTEGDVNDLSISYNDLGAGLESVGGIDSSNIKEINESENYILVDDPYVDTTIQLTNGNSVTSESVRINLTRRVVDQGIFSAGGQYIAEKNYELQLVDYYNNNDPVLNETFLGAGFTKYQQFQSPDSDRVIGDRGLQDKDVGSGVSVGSPSSDTRSDIGFRDAEGNYPFEYGRLIGMLNPEDEMKITELGFEDSPDINESVNEVKLVDNQSKTHNLSNQVFYNSSVIEVESAYDIPYYNFTESGERTDQGLDVGVNNFNSEILDTGIDRDFLSVEGTSSELQLKTGVTHNLTDTFYNNFTTKDVNNSFDSQIENVNISSACSGAGVKDVGTGVSTFSCPDDSEDLSVDDMGSEEFFYTQDGDHPQTSDLSTQYYYNVTNFRFENNAGAIVDVNTTSKCSSGGVITALTGNNEISNCENQTVSDDLLVNSASVFDRKNESLQQGNLTEQSYREVYDLEVENTGSFTLENVDIGGISNLKDKVNIPSGQQVIQDHRYELRTGDFLSNVSKVSGLIVDSDKESTFQTQYFENESTISFENSENVSLGNVSIASECSDTTSVDVGAEENISVSCNQDDQQVLDRVSRQNVSNISFTSVAEFGAGISTGSVAFKDFKAENTFSGSVPINLSDQYSTPKKCSLSNSEEQSFPNGVSTQSLAFNCQVGKENSVSSISTNDLGSTTEYVYEAEFELYQDPPLGDRQYCIPQTRLTSYSERITGSRTVEVDGTSSGFTGDNKIVQNEQYLCVNLPEDEIGASPHNTSVTYEVDGGDSGGSGGSGGGSGGGDSGGLIGTGTDVDSGALNVENSTYEWRISALGSPTQSTFSLFGNSGESDSIPIQLTNLGEREVNLSLAVTSQRSVVENNVELSQENVTLDPDGLGSATVDVSYSIPEGYDEENFNFRVRASDPTWDGEGQTVGVEYADFNIAMNDVLSIFLDRYSRVGKIIEFNPSVTPAPLPIPFLLIPLLPSMVVFALSRTLSAKGGAVLVAQAGGVILLFIVLIGIIPPL